MNQSEGLAASKTKFYSLLREIRQDAKSGIKRFYEEYGKFIYCTALSVCRSADKANEIVDDVLIKIWKNSATKDEIRNPVGWIYTITVNKAKDSLRQKSVLPLNEALAGEDGSIRQFLEEDCFYRLIENLSEMEQQILIERFILRNTFQEIAEDIRKPLTTISSVYYRALAKLKAQLK